MTTYKDNKYHARSRIQRAFLAWFKTARKQLLLPFRITKRNKNLIFLDYEKAGLRVSGLLNPYGLHISLFWQEGVESAVLWNEARTKLTSNGYKCKQSADPEEWGDEVYVHKTRLSYPTREDLWRVHLFDVFLDYVNNTLTKYPFIEIYDVKSSMYYSGGAVSSGDRFGVIPRSSKDERVEHFDLSNINNRVIPNPIYMP